MDNDNLFGWEEEPARYSSRDTSSGTSTENTLATCLRENGYRIPNSKRNESIGRVYGVKHTPDWLAVRDGKIYIIESKNQGKSGALYPKTLGEVVRIAISMQKNPGRFEAAYIVMTGEALTKAGKPESGYRKFREHMFAAFYRDAIPHSNRIHCVSADKFIDLCNKKML